VSLSSRGDGGGGAWSELRLVNLSSRRGRRWWRALEKWRGRAGSAALEPELLASSEVESELRRRFGSSDGG
jgi:hypothetical protein